MHTYVLYEEKTSPTGNNDLHPARDEGVASRARGHGELCPHGRGLVHDPD